MGLSESQQVLIQKYLSDTLSENDQLLFEQEAKNASFRLALLEQTEMLNALELSKDNDLRDHLKSLDNTSKSLETNSPSSKRNILLIGLAILLAILSWYYFSHSLTTNDIDYNQVYVAHFQQIPADINQRGDNSNDQDIDYEKAMEAYINQDYESAYRTLKLNQNPTPKDKLYQAICLIELGEYSTAKNLLDDVGVSGSKEEIENAEWYKLMVSIREEDRKDIDKRLSNILSNRSHLFYEKASQLSLSLK